MNERIKLLAEQAGMGPWGVGNDDNVSEIVEKYTELIVRECADVAALGQSCTDKGLIKRGVLAHFGVEE